MLDSPDATGHTMIPCGKSEHSTAWDQNRMGFAGQWLAAGARPSFGTDGSAILGRLLFNMGMKS
jgi:hypothetical protein